MKYEVRCCCDAGRLLGHIETTIRPGQSSMTFPLRGPDMREAILLEMAVVVIEGRQYPAFKSGHHPMELLRRIPQFVEYNKTIYACNNRWCGWTGPLHETCMLGAIGPLCPRCRETTQEQ